jgi:alkaline phosphatase
MKYDLDRTVEPSLVEMVEASIKSLSNNEGGRVDHANHDGNLTRARNDGKAFADAIAKALEMANPNETLIIFTADHEHAFAFNGYCGRGSKIKRLCLDVNDEGVANNGEPLLAADSKPYTVAGYLNGAG